MFALFKKQSRNHVATKPVDAKKLPDKLPAYFMLSVVKVGSSLATGR